MCPRGMHRRIRDGTDAHHGRLCGCGVTFKRRINPMAVARLRLTLPRRALRARMLISERTLN
jgi:hypothetical protein